VNSKTGINKVLCHKTRNQITWEYVIAFQTNEERHNENTQIPSRITLELLPAPSKPIALTLLAKLRGTRRVFS